MTVKILKFYRDRGVIGFSVEAFQFSKFYENEAKHDKRNFKRGLRLAFDPRNA